MAECLGVEPSEPLRALQISNLLHYRPAHTPWRKTTYSKRKPLRAPTAFQAVPTPRWFIFHGGERSIRNPAPFRGPIRFRDGPGTPVRFTHQLFNTIRISGNVLLFFLSQFQRPKQKTADLMRIDGH